MTINEEISDSVGSKEKKETDFCDTNFDPSCSSKPPLLTQKDRKDLIRDLKL